LEHLLQGRLRGGKEKKTKVQAVHAALDANLRKYKKKKVQKKRAKGASISAKKGACISGYTCTSFALDAKLRKYFHLHLRCMRICAKKKGEGAG
jgi:hypothetical protein